MSSPALAALVGAAVDVAASITDDDLALPTPCPEFNVHELAEHWFAMVVGLESTLRTGRLASDDPWGLKAHDGADLTTTLAASLRSLGECLAEPGIADGVAFSGMPQQTNWHLAVAEIALHAWDLAVAVGRDFTPDPWSARLVHNSVATIARGAYLEGNFAAPVPVVSNDPWQRTLALSGRDPKGTGGVRG